MVKHISNKIQNAIQMELFKAKKSIKIAVAWFTNDLLLQPLILKLRNGVSVELIINDDDINRGGETSLDFTEYLQVGGILRWNDTKQLLHDKFCIIDDNIVIFGSYNWTNKAEYNEESVAISKDDAETILFYSNKFLNLQKKYSTKELHSCNKCQKSQTTKIELKDIDIHFDVRKDSYGKDPDSASATLRLYHKLLWSKPLPNGQVMKLDEGKGYYLKWNDMYFGSDSIIVSFMHYGYKLRDYIQQNIPNYSDFRENYLKKSYTIGGSIIFPQLRWSMNQARGCSRKISDRWDLTLECIRRYYIGESSPLDTAIFKSKAFFDLFVDFKGYVDFFLLQDCVDENYNVKFWLKTPLFISDPMPKSLSSYHAWIDAEMDFLSRRQKRIQEYCGLSSKPKKNNNMDNFKQGISAIIDSGKYSQVMNGALRLIIEDKMNSIELNKYLSEQGTDFNRLKEEALNVVIDYANICLEDNALSEKEMEQIGLLKLFFRIKEGDFYKFGKEKEVKQVLSIQLRKMYNDDFINKDEALMKNDLQSLFGLSYDEFLIIVNAIAEESLQRGGNLKDLDTIIIK